MRTALAFTCWLPVLASPLLASQPANDKPPVSIDPSKSCLTSTCHATGFTGPGLHRPVQEGKCRSCHVPQGKRHEFRPIALKEKMCLLCHEKIRPVKGAVFHSGIKAAGCVRCHDPHQSAYPHLLKAKDLRSLCLRCHNDLTKKRKFIHSAVEDEESCSYCHADHASNFPGLLKKSPQSVCLPCHGQIRSQLKRPHVHTPAKESCTFCHTPHASNLAHLLRSSVPGLCFKCHPKVRDEIRFATSHHAPVSQGRCLDCHEPHATKAVKLLRRTPKAGCLACHDRIATELKQATLKGKPAHGTSCIECHAPHGAGNPWILKKRFSKDFYRATKDPPDQLCFGCHDKSLMAREKSTDTQFRDGRRNLHFVHARGGQGRSCSVCHAVHGLTSSHPVRLDVRFGRWSLPHRFEKTPSGGRCLSGCHQPMGYDRINPVGKR